MFTAVSTISMLYRAIFYGVDMESSKVLPTDWITLNVGGKHFYTTKTTLLKGDTMLSSMLSSDIPKATDEHGAILIDRDSKHFNKILNFLRNGIGPVLDTEQDANELKLENESDSLSHRISIQLDYRDHKTT